MSNTSEPRDVRVTRTKVRVAALSGETYEPPESMTTRTRGRHSSVSLKGRRVSRSRVSWEYNDEIPDPEAVIPE